MTITPTTTALQSSSDTGQITNFKSWPTPNLALTNLRACNLHFNRYPQTQSYSNYWSQQQKFPEQMSNHHSFIFKYIFSIRKAFAYIGVISLSKLKGTGDCLLYAKPKSIWFTNMNTPKAWPVNGNVQLILTASHHHHLAKEGVYTVLS